MDSYVDNAFQNGKYRLICQYGGCSSNELGELLRGNEVVAYGIPKTQSLECTWNFKLYFADETELVFKAKCTDVGGWDEIGSLSIDLESKIAKHEPDWLSKEDIGEFRVERYSMLVYEEEKIYAEAGICLFNDAGEKIVVLAAGPAGAVSASIPNVGAELTSEFDMADYDCKTAVTV